MSTETQAKDIPIETNFYATFKPSVSVSESQVELNINGIWSATVRGRGFTPNTELKGTIRIQPNITKVPNSYLITRVRNDIIFLFRSREAGEPIIGGASFPYPFENDIDWHGSLEWKPLVPIPHKMDGSTLNATPDESWRHASITVRVEKGAVSRLVVARAAGHQGSLEIDSDINANPPFPSYLIGTLWYKPGMFNLGINSWQLTAKKPGGYYLTFAPEIAIDPSLLGYAHLDTINDMVPTPGDWFGNVLWVLDSQPIQPPESNKPITLSLLQGVLDPVPTATVGDHVTDLPGLNDFFKRVLHTGDYTINVHGWIHIDKPGLLFGEGTWVMQVHRANIPPGNSIFAVLTFYSNFLIDDMPLVVGQATFHGMFDNPQSEDPPTEWAGEYSWRSTIPAPITICPPKNAITPTHPPKKNLPLTAEITLGLPNVAIRNREITASFGDWFAVLPDDFAKFFIYTPYEFPLSFFSPKIVTGTLLYEASLTGAKNRWTVETAYGDDQAIMTLYSTLLGPLLPLGFAIFNGKFPAGKWEGILEWKKRIEDTADETVEA